MSPTGSIPAEIAIRLEQVTPYRRIELDEVRFEPFRRLIARFPGEPLNDVEADDDFHHSLYAFRDSCILLNIVYSHLRPLSVRSQSTERACLQ